MAWSAKTKPTSANIRKRIDAAIDALDAAKELLGASGESGQRANRLRANISNARAWAYSASEITRQRAKAGK